MKSSRKAAILAVPFALVLLLLLLWWDALSEPSKQSADTSQVALDGATALGSSAAPPSESKRQQTRDLLLAAANHKDIEFYGKVVDQDGVPLASVDVYASVIYNSGVAAGLDKKQTKTDGMGTFSITGMAGRTLGIGLEKDGFEYGGDHGPFQFTELVTDAERYHPEAENPVVFRMWRLQGAESLIYGDGRIFELSPDGTPVRIDLRTGEKVASDGDLIVTLQQPVAQKGQQLLHYRWTATITANALIEGTEKLMYRAPDAGYVSALNFGETGDERVQQNGVEKRIYVRTSLGQYARVQLVISSRSNPDRPSTVGLTWWLNPTPGSRNLEFDPTKTIQPPL